MTDPGGRVKVWRIANKAWAVTCDICEGGILTLLPWATAANYSTAMTLADWHITEHRTRSCGHCHRTDTLPRPQAVDEVHMNFDGRLYEVRSTGVVPIGQAAPTKGAR